MATIAPKLTCAQPMSAQFATPHRIYASVTHLTNTGTQLFHTAVRNKYSRFKIMHFLTKFNFQARMDPMVRHVRLLYYAIRCTN